MQHQVTKGGQRQDRAKARITRDGPLQEPQTVYGPLPIPGLRALQGAQIEVVGSEVAGRPLSGSPDLSSLQCRLDNAGNADSDFGLKLKDILQ
jgi:hypothetical protein